MKAHCRHIKCKLMLIQKYYDLFTQKRNEPKELNWIPKHNRETKVHQKWKKEFDRTNGANQHETTRKTHKTGKIINGLMENPVYPFGNFKLMLNFCVSY